MDSRRELRSSGGGRSSGGSRSSGSSSGYSGSTRSSVSASGHTYYTVHHYYSFAYYGAGARNTCYEEDLECIKDQQKNASVATTVITIISCVVSGLIVSCSLFILVIRCCLICKCCCFKPKKVDIKPSSEEMMGPVSMSNVEIT